MLLPSRRGEEGSPSLHVPRYNAAIQIRLYQHQPQRNHELLPLRGARDCLSITYSESAVPCTLTPRGCTTKRKLITPHLPLAATETQAHTQDPSAVRLPRLAVHPLTLRLYTRNARAPTSPRSIGFCVIWDCISSSSSSRRNRRIKNKRPQANPRRSS